MMVLCDMVCILGSNKGKYEERSVLVLIPADKRRCASSPDSITRRFMNPSGIVRTCLVLKVDN